MGNRSDPIRRADKKGATVTETSPGGRWTEGIDPRAGHEYVESRSGDAFVDVAPQTTIAGFTPKQWALMAVAPLCLIILGTVYMMVTPSRQQTEPVQAAVKVQQKPKRQVEVLQTPRPVAVQPRPIDPTIAPLAAAVVTPPIVQPPAAVVVPLPLSNYAARFCRSGDSALTCLARMQVDRRLAEAAADVQKAGASQTPAGAGGPSVVSVLDGAGAPRPRTQRPPPPPSFETSVDVRSVAGTPPNLSAQLRLPSGKVVDVITGDTIAGRRVSAIDLNGITLETPKGQKVRVDVRQ